VRRFGMSSRKSSRICSHRSRIADASAGGIRGICGFDDMRLQALLPAIFSSFAGRDCGSYVRAPQLADGTLYKAGRPRDCSASGWAERPFQDGISHLQRLPAPTTRAATTCYSTEGPM
jgi:hypothetical protein